jgi:hypothetical protein
MGAGGSYDTSPPYFVISTSLPSSASETKACTTPSFEFMLAAEEEEEEEAKRRRRRS